MEDKSYRYSSMSKSKKKRMSDYSARKSAVSNNQNSDQNKSEFDKMKDVYMATKSTYSTLDKYLKNSKYRWVNLVSLFFMVTVHYSQATTFTSISKIISQAYDISPILVNSSTIVFQIAFVCFNFPAIIALEAGTQGYGLSISVSNSFSKSLSDD